MSKRGGKTIEEDKWGGAVGARRLLKPARPALRRRVCCHVWGNAYQFDLDE